MDYHITYTSQDILPKTDFGPSPRGQRAPRQVTKLFATRGSVRATEARVGSDINPHSRASQELYSFKSNKTEIVAAMRSIISILSIRYDAAALVSMRVLPKGPKQTTSERACAPFGKRTLMKAAWVSRAIGLAACLNATNLSLCSRLRPSSRGAGGNKQQ